MSVAKGIGYGALGYILDSLAPAGPLDPLSFAFFIILLFVIMSERIPAWAKVILSFMLIVAMFFSPSEAAPVLDGVDAGAVMAVAGFAAGSGVASYRFRM